jgi:hypothetical protein
MPRLHVALQDGFAHDPVHIRIGTHEVYQSADLSTRQQIGLADSFDTTVERGDVTLDIALPARPHPHQQVTLHVATDVFVGVSLDLHGTLRHRVSSTPFGYA